MAPLIIAQYMIAAAFGTVALMHMLVWFRHKDFLPHLFFAWTAAAAAGNAISEAWMYRTETVDAIVSALKCYVLFSGLWLIGLIWFVVTVFRIRSTWSWWLAWALTVFFLVAIVLNLLLRFGLLYSEISGLREITLPWREKVVFANGTSRAWRFAVDLAQIGLLVLVFAGSITMWRHGERWRALLLGSSMIVFIIFFAVVATLIDTGLLELPYLTSYGFLIVVLVTSNDLAKEISNAAILSREVIENERRWRSLLDALPAYIVSLDQLDRINYVNAYFEHRTGYQSSTILGQPFSRLVKNSEIARLEQLFQETREKSPCAETELSLITTTDQEFNVLWTKVLLRDAEGEIVGRIGIGRDITEQRNRETELRQAVDEERSRIAGELHDSVTQTLFSTAAIADALPDVWTRHPEKARKGLEDLRSMIKGALAEMRTLLVELRPESLLNRSLSELLVQLGDAIVARTRMPIEVTVSCDDLLPVQVQIALYRIAQEAMNNVIKHSEADSATLRLHNSKNKVVLTVSDNGLGFEPNHSKSGRLGLGIMRDRARSIGADLNIKTQPNSGTTVEVTWSYESGGDGGDRAEPHSRDDR